MLRTPTPPLPADAAPELSQETPSPRPALSSRARLSAIAAADRKPDERTIERSAIDEDGLVSLLLDSSTLEPALNYRLDLFAISAGKEPVRIFRQTFRR
jgi:hypothetical protein